MAGSSRKSKRPKRSHVVKEVATLSDFPDEILHYILSFLDTKSAVGTSILSRRWRCLLTTLELRECPLSPYCPILPFDLIGDLPCLKYLKLIRCFIAAPDCWLLISGPQLLDLEVEFTNHYRFYELMIAPKLKSLRLWGEYIDEYLPKLDLPSLDHANIRLKWEPERWEDDDPVFIEQNSAFVNYLCGLHNVESLKLCFDKEQRWKNDWEEQPFPLNRIKALVEHEASPLNRLKTLTIQCAHQRHPPNVPYQVIRYFLEGSSNTEEKFVKFKMLAN
ncbi:unnamed protein product [Linum trigynum]|uniref:F-box domain-containing protein n=1 Tax=Linum trigynum TaxID=586398 RepID=A0AAV2C8K5_9ROSI